MPKGLQSYSASAIQRLSYLFPKCQFECEMESIIVTSIELLQSNEIEKAVLYELYRAKIRDTTHEMQQLLYRTAFSQ